MPRIDQHVFAIGLDQRALAMLDVENLDFHHRESSASSCLPITITSV